MDILNPQQFFAEDYSAFSAYDNIRKIAHIADGMKNASRKILHASLISSSTEFIKVSNLGPRIQDATEYLHGSLEGTLVNMTASYVGSGNNIPVLLGDGNFGTRFVNEASASRYISAKLNPIMKSIFLKEDNNIVDAQVFEGSRIEPRFYVPVIPMIFINGVDGVSVGYAQKILPRNPKTIIDAVKARLNNKPIKDFTPWYKGFTGKIVQGESDKQWIISGEIERVNSTRIKINELPINYTLKSYLKVLDSLVERNIIQDYADESDNDKFQFVVRVTREFGSQSDEQILSKLKLVTTITENYTATTEDNRVTRYDNVEQMIDDWIKIRLKYTESRKNYILEKLNSVIGDNTIKINFIEAVVTGKLEIRNKSLENIKTQAKELDKDILNSIESLIDIPMKYLTTEKIQQLSDEIESSKTEYLNLEQKTVSTICLEDITKLDKELA